MGKNKTFEEIENAMTHQTSISQNSIEMEHLTGTTIELKNAHLITSASPSLVFF